MRIDTTTDGHTYLTAGAVRDQPGYADLAPALLSAWVTARKLAPATVADLAAALGRPVPPGVDPTAPAMAPGRSGPEYVYRWADIVRVETATRMTRRRRGGRPRRATP